MGGESWHAIKTLFNVPFLILSVRQLLIYLVWIWRVITTTSTVCVYMKDFQLLQNALKAHSIYQAIVLGKLLTLMEVHSFTTTLFQ